MKVDDPAGSIPLSLRLLRRLGHQTWIPFSVRDRIIRRFCHPEAGVDVAFCVDFFQDRYSGTLNSFLDWTVFFYGAHERSELLFLRDVIHRHSGPITLLDIGANVGHHSLFLSRHAARIFAFEPWPPAVAQLRRRLEENNVTNVTVHPLALGAETGELVFHAPCTGNQGTGSFVPGANGASNRTSSPVPVVRGDDYFREHLDGPIHILKLDVEGFEPAVLAGLTQTVAHFRPIVSLELSETALNAFGSYDGFMRAWPDGYEFLGLEARGNGYALVALESRPGTQVVAYPKESAGLIPRS